MSRRNPCPAAFPLVDGDSVCRIAESIDGTGRPAFNDEEACTPY